MLIYLNQNQENNVVLTLREKSLLWLYSSYTPFYLFQFTNVTTNQTLFFTGPNLSSLSAQDSYDQFNIICTGATYVNYSASTINLNPGMFWTYKVYEQQDQYNFQLSGTVSCVETGKVMFCAATQDFSYINMTGNSSYITFNTYN